MDFQEVEDKHQQLIKIAKQYMLKIQDKEHDINHMNDVVSFTKQILINLKQEVDIEICLIGAYWHDVGRTELNNGHEKLSSQMLQRQMNELHYDKKFIKSCGKAIEFHKWDMNPTTLEGLVIKDADKLAWLGCGRWESCLKDLYKIDSIIELLPRLREEILYFECSKKLYDEQILKVLLLLYNKIYN